MSERVVLRRATGAGCVGASMESVRPGKCETRSALVAGAEGGRRWQKRQGEREREREACVSQDGWWFRQMGEWRAGMR